MKKNLERILFKMKERFRSFFENDLKDRKNDLKFDQKDERKV
tara:strand:- start:316 stop:441 length:126 start_codon:yes stop_codon:yes gene_type:complete